MVETLQEFNIIRFNLDKILHKFFEEDIQIKRKVELDLLNLMAKFQFYHDTNIKPNYHVHVHVLYKEGVNLEQKQKTISNEHKMDSFPGRWGKGLIFTENIDFEKIKKISHDPDVLKMTGWEAF